MNERELDISDDALIRAAVTFGWRLGLLIGVIAGIVVGLLLAAVA